ncbi:hypothetical protein HK097_006365 [Rhizophlyctis rosea]|uniref:Uncharacterized protein n=1 Tax=Rhizophlyctis rosea TaxID=64517 RepID=A0AAD5X6P5_9FUNG|nr:hypothetical protein HK097_006365 [Rhizophlyctis rosea]
MLPRARSAATKSSVKPVPDFAKLHQKWESHLSQTRNPTSRSKPSTEAEARPNSRPKDTASSHPAPDPPANTTKPRKSNESKENDPRPAARSLQPRATTSRNSDQTSVAAKKPDPPAASSAAPAPNNPPPRPALKGPARVVKKAASTAALPHVGVSFADDEFNNESLAEILESTNASELDMNRDRRATGAFNLDRARRVGNPALAGRRATVSAKAWVGISILKRFMESVC